jgi:hypothetical protein
MFVGLSALFYLVLLFSPLALLQTANAESNQDPLQESYGTGKLSFPPQRPQLANELTYPLTQQSLVLILEPPTPVLV